jgi:predicted permease
LPKTLGASFGSNIGAETTLELNLPVLLFAMGAAIVTSIMCGLAPAFHAAQGNLQSPLSSAAKGTSSGPRHSRLRGALVVSEVTLSIVLLVGAMLLMRSFYLLTHVDLGFNPKSVLFVAFLPPPSHATSSPIQRFAGTQGQAVLRDVVDRLKKIPGVTEVSIEDTMPGYGPGAGPQVMVPGSTHPDEEAGLLACDENFARTLELRLTQGRWLSRDEVDSAQHVAVINEKLAADFFGAGTTVGKQIKVKAFKGPFRPPEDAYFQIVGVVHDMKNNGPQQPAMPIIFLPYTVRGGFFLLLKTAVNPASLKSAIQQRIWAVDPNEIVGLSGPLTDFLQRNTYATPEFAVLLSAPLSGIALLVAATGIFSVMAYTVSLRTHEIGVRMALGAQRANVLNMVVAEGGGLIASGIVIGLLASYALTRFLASQVWGISSTDPWTFAMVVIVVLLAGISACLIPAYRAARVDPCEALRHE